MKPGRNDSCPCGSGQKYKKCCLAKDEAARSAELAAQAEERRVLDAAAGAEAAAAGRANRPAPTLAGGKPPAPTGPAQPPMRRRFV